jgi:F-type H+-transporting ATPase subunit b
MNLIAAGNIDPAQSVNWLLPATSELIYGGLASIIIFALIYKFAGPAAKKGMADRTAKIQAELDGAAEALDSARTEAEEIRRAAGDIASERARLLADADAHAPPLLSEGRERLAAEIADLEARAQAEAAGLAGRMGDELRVEVSRISSSVVDQLVADSLDDATQQALIEDFIQKVGAQS